MNVQRFTARTAREALALVRQALGDDAVVLSTRPSAEGVEVLALAPDGLARIEQAADQADRARASIAAPAPAVHLIQAPTPGTARPATLAERIAARGEKLVQRLDPRHPPRQDPSMDSAPTPSRPLAGDSAMASRFDASRSQALPEPGLQSSVARDVETLGMSTLTFQDYVRERMLKRRQAELTQQADEPPAPPTPWAPAGPPTRPAAPLRSVASEPRLADAPDAPDAPVAPVVAAAAAPLRHQALRKRIDAPRREPPVLRDEIHFAGPGAQHRLNDGALRPVAQDAAVPATERHELMGELRSVRQLIDERFGMLAFMERLQRDPRQANLSQKLFDAGFSPALVRKLVQSLPVAAEHAPDELAWAAGVLERNLLTDEQALPIEDHNGVLALIGPTGVGKTTTTAKLAAAFATKHGASQLGLITLDAYRVAAHEQLRTYGRILGVPVHTAHDRASLEDLLELLAGKKLVLIDTAGMAQRDTRTRELLDMLQHPAIKKLLVVNAAAQGETVEDVMLGYGVQHCAGVIVSKLDEAVKLGPALDALIRHRCKVVGVANGQRVPEDWHRLTAQALVQRALRGGGGASWRLDAAEVNLLFAATQGAGYPGPQGFHPAAGQAAPQHA